MRSLKWWLVGVSVVVVLAAVLVPIVKGLGSTLPGPPAPVTATAPDSAGPSVVSGPALPGLAAPVVPDADPAVCSTAPLVNCATGEFSPQFTDFSVPGRGLPLEFVRTYSSVHADAGGALGFGWTSNYDVTLSRPGPGVVRISAGNGPGLVFAAAGAGGFRAPPRSFAMLASGPGSGYTLTLLRARTRDVFSAAGLLLRQLSFNGYVTVLQYDAGRLVSVTDPAGRRLRFGYEGGHVSAVTDPLGRTTSFSYDAAGDLAGVIDAAGRTWSFGYDRAHLLRTLTDRDGGVITCTYGAAGKLAALTDPAGGKTAWSYAGDPAAAVGGTTTVTRPDGSAAVFSYASSELMSEVRGGGPASPVASTSYAYDPVTHNVTGMWDPDGNLTSFSYDGNGNLVTSTDPLDRAVTSFTYDSLGQVTTRTVARDEPTTYAYDADGNLLSITDPMGYTTTYGYDGQPGDVTSVTGPSGQVTRYGYDDAGDITSVTVMPRPGESDTTGYGYDRDGNLVCKVSADATAAGLSCPPLGRGGAAGTIVIGRDIVGQITSVTDPDGRVTAYGYDNDGNLTRITDAAGHVTSYAYDPDGRQITVTDPAGGTQSIIYDPSGHVLTQTSAGGHITSYGYDQLGRVTTVTGPLDQVTRYEYDADGNRIRLTAASGAVTTYAYDPDGELTAVAYPGRAAPSVVYSYYPDGSRQTMTDGSGTTSYAYDLDGRLTRVTDGTGNSVLYQYDKSGQLISLTYPGGQTVTRTYDGAGRLVLVTDWLGHTTRSGYDRDGNLTSLAYPDGITQTSVFSRSDELLSITDRTGPAILARFTYTHSSLGQVTADISAGNPPQAYAYTSAGQLASAGGGQYQYDQDGNLTRLPGGTSLSYNAADQLLTLTRPAAGSAAQPPAGPATTSYGYDRNGNRTSITPPGQPAITLSYNQAGQLTAYGTTATYAYDGDGLRISKTVNGATTAFAWDQSGSLPALITAGADAWIDGPRNQPVEQVNHGTVTYLLADQQGSIRLLASAAGKITGTYTYNPYGTVTSQTGPASTPIQYNGQYTDAETGYQYLQARYYDPATGQFLSIDPAVSRTWQAYAYTSGNPLSASDPTGLSWWNPFSWNKHTWQIIGTIALIVATAAAVIGDIAEAAALCAATACVGSPAFWGAVGLAAWGTELTANAATTTADTVIAVKSCQGNTSSSECRDAKDTAAGDASDTVLPWLSQPRDD
jgi:RHS repeat-associated protein